MLGRTGVLLEEDHESPDQMMCMPHFGATVRPMRSLPRLPTLDPRVVDALVGVALAIGCVASEAGHRHHGPLTLVSAGIVGATVAFRRQVPATATAVAVVCIVVDSRSGHNANLSFEPISILLDYYMLGRLSVGRGRLLLEALLLAAAILAVGLSPGNSNPIGLVGVWALFVAIPFAAGRAVGSRSALTHELRENAERLEREQEEQARRVAAEERNRVARELHDVVAHNVSVMVIQTAAARRIAGSDREAAREALWSVERSGRDALLEMRRMIGVLRRGDAELAGAASPGLSQLGTLCERARAAGLPVTLQQEGEPRALSPGAELVAFRVVQEALTNTIKHAGPAHARVRVSFTSEALVVEVSDTGRGPEGSAGGGHGLIGMHERLALYGGELETGGRAEGGFRVAARIPLGEAVAA